MLCKCIEVCSSGELSQTQSTSLRKLTKILRLWLKERRYRGEYTWFQASFDVNPVRDSVGSAVGCHRVSGRLHWVVSAVYVLDGDTTDGAASTGPRGGGMSSFLLKRLNMTFEKNY